MPAVTAAEAIKATRTEVDDAVNPHANAPTDVPNHAISMPMDDPRPRKWSGSCAINVENNTFMSTMSVAPHNNNAGTAVSNDDD